MPVFEHAPHPHIAARQEAGPVKVADQHPAGSAYSRFNTRVALGTTGFVGSMTCAWVFAAIALVSLPAAIASGNVIVIVAWVAQTLLQLVLLSVIMVGQNVQSQAADKRAEATYHDASATYHEASEIQRHLAMQDDRLTAQDAALAAQTTTLAQLIQWHQDQIAGQMAADRDAQDQHLEATRAVGDSLDVLHRALDTTPHAQPAADPRSTL